MDKVKASGAVAPAAPWWSRSWFLAVLYLLVAFAIRTPHFGNPVIHIDEQFYFVVGDRMLDGELPYVDSWDRKPIGLFLIYAAIRLLGGEGIVQYQMVATLFAAATAFLIARMAARVTGPTGRFVAGLCYLCALGLFGGEGGQSPIFYNFFVAAAAALVMAAAARARLDLPAFSYACLAMLLTGIAIQIKYTVIFEGVFFGLFLLWTARRKGAEFGRIAVYSASWAALGLLPTALALGTYALLGQADAFIYANFLSIFERPQPVPGERALRLMKILARLLPLLICAAAAFRLRDKEESLRARETHVFVAAWSAAALFGLIVFGTYYEHYALPLLVPLCVAAAPLLGDNASGIGIRTRGRWFGLPFWLFIPAFSLVLQAQIIGKHRQYWGTGPEVRALASFLNARLRPGDVYFLYDGDPILLYLAKGPLATTRHFPDHLNNSGEDGAIGVDALAETRRVMAGRPRFVVTNREPQHETNWRTWRFMENRLRHDYRPVFEVRVDKCCTRVVYERRDPGARRLQAAAGGR